MGLDQCFIAVPPSMNDPDEICTVGAPVFEFRKNHALADFMIHRAALHGDSELQLYTVTAGTLHQLYLAVHAPEEVTDEPRIWRRDDDPELHEQRHGLQPVIFWGRFMHYYGWMVFYRQG